MLTGAAWWPPAADITLTGRPVGAPRPPGEPVADVLSRLNACSGNRALVFAGGHLAGIVSWADISRAWNGSAAAPAHPH
jgi:hypothetical protein